MLIVETIVLLTGAIGCIIMAYLSTRHDRRHEQGDGRIRESESSS